MIKNEDGFPKIDIKALKVFSDIHNLISLSGAAFYMLIIFMMGSYIGIFYLKEVNPNLKVIVYVVLPIVGFLAFWICLSLARDKSLPTKLRSQFNILNQDRTLVLEDIKTCWHYRKAPEAIEDMQKQMSLCKEKIFISGINLSTLRSIFDCPDFIEDISGNINRNPEFQFTIIVVTFDKYLMMSEREKLFESEGDYHAHYRSSRKVLRDFSEAIEKEVSPKVIRPVIDFKTYKENITPHHFILCCDNYIYLGSYLSHKLGSNSYLLKLINSDSGLSGLFQKEISFLNNNTEKLNINTIQ